MSQANLDSDENRHREHSEQDRVAARRLSSPTETLYLLRRYARVYDSEHLRSLCLQYRHPHHMHPLRQVHPRLPLQAPQRVQTSSPLHAAF